MSETLWDVWREEKDGSNNGRWFTCSDPSTIKKDVQKRCKSLTKASPESLFTVREYKP